MTKASLGEVGRKREWGNGPLGRKHWWEHFKPAGKKDVKRRLLRRFEGADDTGNRRRGRLSGKSGALRW